MKLTAIRHLTVPTAATVYSAQPVKVLVYDYTGLSAAKWTATTELAKRVMKKAGHRVTWLMCRGAGTAPDARSLCTVTLGDNDYVLRLVAGDGSGEHGGRQRLASALLDHGRGRYATPLLEPIRAFAADLGVSSDILLSYAVAHELMHLIHGPAHSRSGLMKAGWTRKDAEDKKPSTTA